MTAKNNMSIPINFKEGLEDLIWTGGGGTAYPRCMPQRRFPRPWRFEPIPGGYRVVDAKWSGAGISLRAARSRRDIPT